jgi:hypothetical protein
MLACLYVDLEYAALFAMPSQELGSCRSVVTERHAGHIKRRHASRRNQSINSSRLESRMLSCFLVGGEVPEDTSVFKSSTRAVWT